jgi:alpha-galactosidase
MRPDGSKLPAPDKREAMLRSLVDLVEFLRRREGLTNVKYLCLMNEPDNDPTRPVPVDEYVRLNRLLDQRLRERGLRGEVFLLGADDCSGGPSEASPWFRQVVSQGVEYCDGLSAHTYKHEYVPGLVPWIRQRRELLPPVEPKQPPKPLLITEFGYDGETFKNWENHKYEYGLFLADFAITALREGAAAALMWCLMDTYYSDRDEHQQQWGLWRYRDQGWEPRPGFYSWSLITRYTRPGSRVVAVEVDPPAHSVRAVALHSPDGERTLLMVNRYGRPLKATLQVGLEREALLRLYRYTRENVPTEVPKVPKVPEISRSPDLPVPGGGMIGAADTLRVAPGTEVVVELPGESFVLLTEVQ